MLKKKLFPFLLLLAVAVILSSCGKKEEEKFDPYAEARPVRTMTLEGGSGGFVKAYPGKTEAKDTVDASFEVAGKIVELPIQRGMQIEKGQTIAKLDAADFENKFAAEKAKFAKAEAELNRYRELYENDAVSLQELEIKERNRNVTEANKKIAEKALQDTVLKAPFAGVVATKYVDNFQSVQAREVIARIQNNEAIEVVIYMPERDIALAKTSELERSVAVFDTYPDREFPISLKEYETQADAVTQTFKVKFILPSPDDVRILPGMSANVTVNLQPKEGQVAPSSFIVPSSAVLPDASGRSYVWVVRPDDQTVEKREVVTGEVTGLEDIQIKDGLHPGEVIATAGVRHLREGMKVRPKEVGTKITE